MRGLNGRHATSRDTNLKIEMNGRQAHRTGTIVLSLAMLAIGVALIAQALTADGVVSPRLLLGVLFLAAGGARLYLELRRTRERRQRETGTGRGRGA